MALLLERGALVNAVDPVYGTTALSQMLQNYGRDCYKQYKSYYRHSPGYGSSSNVEGLQKDPRRILDAETAQAKVETCVTAKVVCENYSTRFFIGLTLARVLESQEILLKPCLNLDCTVTSIGELHIAGASNNASTQWHALSHAPSRIKSSPQFNS
ncbi:hypothetical protein M427DRAFT_334008 [Gonapodya prolifera JEL478]|uniref:Uncharacterized protein n=1 Tax=Gonapodya prolifera (strain JEL478) TaxID=1344416 RepID=A0A139AED4_GONPJ|nr:hypothetical protein M427DRAFT_334008 [Gonapodya prolifera JEL478]|eukprot:KXS15039.1 hypothetical protein M427DRAFT_334008 [Gonapodya prolifera JEL478]